MKKRIFILTALLTAVCLSACGSRQSETASSSSAESAANPAPAQTDIPSSAESGADQTGTAADADSAGADTDALFTGWLPDTVTEEKAETEGNDELKKLIIDYYSIPESDLAGTRYYYNYVDLDGDGKEEIFCAVIGSYTSGSGGDSALWVKEEGQHLEIAQAFTLVSTPVIVADDADSRAKKLILRRSGGGAETEYVELTLQDGVYTNVADAPTIDAVDGISGTAIICNNLIEDTEKETYLSLAD